MTYHIERTDDMVAVTIAGKASATITLTEDGWRELAEAMLEFTTIPASEQGAATPQK